MFDYSNGELTGTTIIPTNANQQNTRTRNSSFCLNL